SNRRSIEEIPSHREFSPDDAVEIVADGAGGVQFQKTDQLLSSARIYRILGGSSAARVLKQRTLNSRIRYHSLSHAMRSKRVPEKRSRSVRRARRRASSGDSASTESTPPMR